METLNIDDTLKQATAIKKQDGFDNAIAFLIFTIKENDVLDYDLIRLLQKIRTYIKSATADTQKTTIEFYEAIAATAQKNNKVSQIDFYEEYANLLIQLGKYSEAEMYISGAIASASPFDATNYLYKASQLYEKRAIAILATNRNEFKKSVDHLYYHLGGHLLTIAWHLYVDGKNNIERFIASQYASSLGFKDFEIFHNIKDSNEESEYPFDTEQNETAFSIISKGKDIEKFCAIFQEIAFKKYPETIGFKEEFLNPNFKDLKKFATSFANEHGEINFETIVPSKAVIAVDDFVNEFLKQVTE
jgi:tetratricopeptide (TPR) repeat protein